MTHIDGVSASLPGITGLLEYRQDTGDPIRELTQLLLRGESTLTQGERELIATYVSSLNRCKYCSSIRGAIAKAHLQDGDVVARVKVDPDVYDQMGAHRAETGYLTTGKPLAPK